MDQPGTAPSPGSPIGPVTVAAHATPWPPPAPGRWRGRRLAALAAWACLTGASLRAAPPGNDPAWPTAALQTLNEARLRHGLWALTAAPDLQAIAQDHSAAMAAARRLSHAGFQARFDRTTSALCVENVAVGAQHPAQLLDAWERAPQHRRNLFERRIRHAGIASVNGYVTLFACE